MTLFCLPYPTVFVNLVCMCLRQVVLFSVNKNLIDWSVYSCISGFKQLWSKDLVKFLSIFRKKAQTPCYTSSHRVAHIFCQIYFIHALNLFHRKCLSYACRCLHCTFCTSSMLFVLNVLHTWLGLISNMFNISCALCCILGSYHAHLPASWTV